MKIVQPAEKALREVAEEFVYKSDGRLDRWTGNNPGDCEDFALRVLSTMFGGKDKARKALMIGEAHMWYVKTKSGAGHAVLEYDGKFTDVRYRKWVGSLDDLNLKDKPRWRYPKVLLVPKLAAGLLLGLFRKK